MAGVDPYDDMTWKLAARCTRCVGVRGINEGWRLYWFISRDGGDLYSMHGLTQTDGGIDVCKLFLFLFLLYFYFILFNFICGPKFGEV